MLVIDDSILLVILLA